jgi:multidrug efflux system membrane fusion protein
VVFTLPEQRVELVNQKFAEGPVKILALGRDNKTVLDEGRLAVIDNQIDVTTGTIKLKATFPNKNLRLWPGQFVNPRVLVDETNGLVVGENVIQRGPDGEYVFAIEGQGTNLTAKLTPVQVAQMEDGLALIAGGLTEGQPVVVDGQYRLEDGSKLSVSTNSAGGVGRGGRRGGGGPTNQPSAALFPPDFTRLPGDVIVWSGTSEGPNGERTNFFRSVTNKQVALRP